MRQGPSPEKAPRKGPYSKACAVVEGNDRLKRVGAYLLMGTAFVSCPCHLIFSLPLALGLLGGTALGVALAANTLLIVTAMTAYFFVALVGGSYLLGQVWKAAEKGRGSTTLPNRKKKTPGRSRNRAVPGSRRPKAKR